MLGEKKYDRKYSGGSQTPATRWERKIWCRAKRGRAVINLEMASSSMLMNPETSGKALEAQADAVESADIALNHG